MPIHIFDLGEDLVKEFDQKRGKRSAREFVKELLNPKPIVQAPQQATPFQPDNIKALITENNQLKGALADAINAQGKLAKKLKKFKELKEEE